MRIPTVSPLAFTLALGLSAAALAVTPIVLARGGGPVAGPAVPPPPAPSAGPVSNGEDGAAVNEAGRENAEDKRIARRLAVRTWGPCMKSEIQRSLTLSTS